jgi:dTDP-4-dehydrorhamnose reductase
MNSCIHVIGAASFIGKRLLSYLKPPMMVLSYSHSPMLGMQTIELTKPDRFDYSKINQGDYIVFLAAISSPDFCETHFDTAYGVNVIGTKKYIKRFIEKGANVLFFSSDTVLGATIKSCDENSLCNPFGSYARMKWEIEDYFKNIQQFKAFRLSYVFSREDRFSRYLRQCDQEDKTAEVYNGLRRNVIYLNDVLDAIQKLRDRFLEFHNAIFHLSGLDLLSRLDLAMLYKQNVSPKFCYRVIDPPEGFFNSRPNTIETNSLYLPDLLGRNVLSISSAFLHEFFDRRI